MEVSIESKYKLENKLTNGIKILGATREKNPDTTELKIVVVYCEAHQKEIVLATRYFIYYTNGRGTGIAEGKMNSLAKHMQDLGVEKLDWIKDKESVITILPKILRNYL